MSDKILIVDDDVELCRELAEILRSEGYNVDDVFDSRNAQALLKKNRYGICIFDYKMPYISGTELLKIAKETNPGTVVFIISGKSFLEKALEEEQVFHLAASVLKKPFDIEILLQKIKDIAQP